MMGEWIEYDRAYFATAMNHPFEGGGFKFCPDADPCDDILNVTVISGLPKWKVLCLLPTAFKGWHIRFKGIDTYTCKKVEIDSEQALPGTYRWRTGISAAENDSSIRTGQDQTYCWII